ncbi:MAG: DUF4233 domain-containing protein [Micromonosporaceae bacterium]|nr:DUF4233 domain-containing protein [Micromonosporaceae bacterium]
MDAPVTGESRQSDLDHRDGGRSGLRNPVRAVRVMGALTLVIEAVVLLLAIQPIRVLGGPHVTQAVTVVVVLAGVALVLASLLRYPAAWYAVGALNAAVTLSGFFQWALAVMGVVFALVWWYVLHVRRTILGSS